MNRTVFGILTIIFNQVGVPNFIVGDTKTGVLKIILCITVVVPVINFIKGIIKGIEILKMTDEEFNAADMKDFIVVIPAGK